MEWRRNIINKTISNLATRENVLSLHRCCELFENYWFKKSARKTVNRISTLSHFIFDITYVMGDNVEKNENYLASMISIFVGLKDLEENPKFIKKAFRKPTEEAREEFIRTIDWLQKKFSWRKFAKRFPDLWKKIIESDMKKFYFK